jgi:Cytochrome bd-type quinol oxidase, subunit 1
VFYAFRIMVGIGVLMLLLAWASAFAWWRGTLLRSRLLLGAWNLMLPAGFIALVAGWFVTEIGRQPWVVHGLMRTADAVGEQSAGMVLASLATYVVGYAFVFGFGVWYLARLVRRGPVPDRDGPDLEGGERTPARPISAAGMPGEDQ